MSRRVERPKVGIIMGSDSDLETVWPAGRALEALGLEDLKDIEWDIRSVHRTPDRAVAYARTARKRGLNVIIAAAGGSAHLPGIVASETILPVVGVAVTQNPDVMNRALGSMIGMPEGKTLATYQGKSGAFNAGLFAGRILALHDPELAERYLAYDQQLRSGVIDKAKLLHRLGPAEYLKEMARRAAAADDIHQHGAWEH